MGFKFLWTYKYPNFVLGRFVVSDLPPWNSGSAHAVFNFNGRTVWSHAMEAARQYLYPIDQALLGVAASSMRTGAHRRWARRKPKWRWRSGLHVLASQRWVQMIIVALGKVPLWPTVTL